jgi:hypothetical protein
MAVSAAGSAHWSVDTFRTWIDQLDEDSAPRDVNEWLGIRTAPRSRVHDSSLAPTVRRAWGEVFLSLVGCAERCAAYGPWDAAIDRANVRAFVIRELGPNGDDHWHPPAALRSILAALALDPERADALAQQWRELPRARILLLRRHKQLVGPPMATVLDHVPEGIYAELARRWLAVRPRLP